MALGPPGPSECGRKKVEMGASQRDSLCISPWPLPLVPSPKLLLAPGSPTPARRTYFFPHLYFRVSSKIKNIEIKGEKEKLFTGVTKAAELGWGERRVGEATRKSLSVGQNLPGVKFQLDFIAFYYDAKKNLRPSLEKRAGAFLTGLRIGGRCRDSDHCSR